MCRASSLWEELPLAMDKLSETRYQARPIYTRRRADYYPAACNFRKQVIRQTILFDILNERLPNFRVSNPVIAKVDITYYCSCDASAM